MSSHRAVPSPRRLRPSLRSGRVRALLALGAVVPVFLGATGTLAFFTDDATLNTGTFATGKLDLTLDDSPDTVGQGGAVAKTTLAIGAMVPGESVAASVKVANNNGVAFTYKANGRLVSSTFPTTSPGLEFEVWAGAGATATNTGAAATYNRVGTCGGTRLLDASPLTTTATDVITTARALASNASENVCIVARLNAGAGNPFQDKTAQAQFVFRAAQVGVAP